MLALGKSLLTLYLHQSRELEVKGHFSQFHYWNLQMSPTADDKLLQALVWAQLAPSVSLTFLPLSSSSYTSPSFLSLHLIPFDPTSLL